MEGIKRYSTKETQFYYTFYKTTKQSLQSENVNVNMWYGYVWYVSSLENRIKHCLSKGFTGHVKRKSVEAS